MRVVTPNIVAPTQFDSDSLYYDPKSSPQSPRWYTVVVEFIEAFLRSLPLETLKQEFSDEELLVVRLGNLLSVIQWQRQ